MDERDPAGVVRSQLDAYNRHDVDRFLSFYASDARIIDRDGSVLDEGHEAMRKTFTELFIRMPEVPCRIPGSDRGRRVGRRPRCRPQLADAGRP